MTYQIVLLDGNNILGWQFRRNSDSAFRRIFSEFRRIPRNSAGFRFFESESAGIENVPKPALISEFRSGIGIPVF